MPANPQLGIVLIPFVAAAVLTVIPMRRLAGWVNLAAALLTFAAACLSPWWDGAPANPLGAHFVIVAALVALTGAWCGRDETLGDERRAGRFLATFQGLAGAVLLALMADGPLLAWVGMALAAAASGAALLLRPTSQDAGPDVETPALALAAALTLVLSGVLLLPASGWSSLSESAGRTDGTLLGIGCAFLLVGLGTLAALAPLHGWLTDLAAALPASLAALVIGAWLPAGLILLLRLRTGIGHAGALAPGPPLMAVGLLSLLLSALALFRLTDPRRVVTMAAMGQFGLVAFAFGLGGPSGIFAGLLHLTMLMPITAAAFQSLASGHARFTGPTFAASLGALAGLPPSGLFVSVCLVLSETVRRAGALWIPLGIGLAIFVSGMVTRLRDRPPIPSVRDGTVLALAPIWAQLLLATVIGFAAPGALTDWLGGIAASMAR